MQFFKMYYALKNLAIKGTDFTFRENSTIESCRVKTYKLIRMKILFETLKLEIIGGRCRRASPGTTVIQA